MRARLTGNHIVAIVASVCLALVLAPVGVYAASVAKVRIVDAGSANRAVKVDRSGRLQTSSSVTGSVAASVSGSVSARPAPPSEPFDRLELIAIATSEVVGPPIPKGKSLAIGSVRYTWISAGGLSTVEVRKAEPNGTCTTTGTLVAPVTYLRFGTEDRFVSATYPVPVVVKATDTALCLVAGAAGDAYVQITGFTF